MFSKRDPTHLEKDWTRSKYLRRRKLTDPPSAKNQLSHRDRQTDSKQASKPWPRRWRAVADEGPRSPKGVFVCHAMRERPLLASKLSASVFWTWVVWVSFENLKFWWNFEILKFCNLKFWNSVEIWIWKPAAWIFKSSRRACFFRGNSSRSARSCRTTRAGQAASRQPRRPREAAQRRLILQGLGIIVAAGRQAGRQADVQRPDVDGREQAEEERQVVSFLCGRPLGLAWRRARECGGQDDSSLGLRRAQRRCCYAVRHGAGGGTQEITPGNNGRPLVEDGNARSLARLRAGRRGCVAWGRRERKEDKACSAGAWVSWAWGALDLRTIAIEIAGGRKVRIIL